MAKYFFYQRNGVIFDISTLYQEHNGVSGQAINDGYDGNFNPLDGKTPEEWITANGINVDPIYCVLIDKTDGEAKFIKCFSIDNFISDGDLIVDGKIKKYPSKPLNDYVLEYYKDQYSTQVLAGKVKVSFGEYKGLPEYLSDNRPSSMVYKNKEYDIIYHGIDENIVIDSQIYENLAKKACNDALKSFGYEVKTLTIGPIA